MKIEIENGNGSLDEPYWIWVDERPVANIFKENEGYVVFKKCPHELKRMYVGKTINEAISELMLNMNNWFGIKL